MAEQPALRYHRLTRYELDRHWLVPADDPAVVQDFLPMAGERRPPDRKTYPPELPRIELPPGSPVPEAAGQATACTRLPLSLAEVAWLLQWSAGVVRVRSSRTGRPVSFRAASSAGNLQPVEVYLQAAGVRGLPDAVWHYAAHDRELVRVAPPAARGVTFILTGVPWRTEWKYAERGYRYLWWDAGSLAAHLELLAGSLGHPASMRLSFPDRAVAAVVGADARAEIPLALVDLGNGGVRLTAQAVAARGELGRPGPDFPLVREAHEAGSLTDWPLEDAVRPFRPAGPQSGWSPAGAGELARRRAVCRSFRRQPAGLSAVLSLLAAAAAPVDWDAGQVAAAFRVLVLGGAGPLEPGCYQFVDGGLEPVTTGDLRAEAVASCLDQAAAGDCACLLLLAVDLERQLRARGQRGYREVQFYAGLVAGRLQLHASAHELGCIPLTVRDAAASRHVPPGMAPLVAVAIGLPLAGPAVPDRP